MLRTQGIAHFTLPVQDLDRSIAFYSEILGLDLVAKVPDLAFFRSGKDHVVLARIDPSKQSEAVPTPRNFHHAFIVESRDFESSLQFLASKNVEIIGEEERAQGVFTGRSAYFNDPDGNVLEIIDLVATAHRPKNGG
jgi:catechol 2,3-dioxygenase-like lactoylglutathione lyase family enzyme